MSKGLKFHILFAVVVSITPIKAQVRLNEVCAANGDVAMDPDFFQFPSWLELYNPSSTALPVGGYHLSNSFSQPRQWSIPAGTVISPNSRLIVWCDGMNAGLHANFELNQGGDHAYLSDPAGNLLDSISFGAQPLNSSFARIADGNPAWRQTAPPTPARPNAAGPLNGPLPPPELSMPSGRYSSPVTITISSVPNAAIRFTTDGSEPDLASTLYTVPLTINATMVLKAVALHADYLQSPVAAATYFINERTFTLPVVSLTTNPGYLFNDSLGIFVPGKYGITGKCSTVPVNWNQNWERHALLEYLTPTGSRLFRQNINIRVAGNCSRKFPQKSLELESNGKYEAGKFAFPFFPGKAGISEYDNLFLRNSGNDWNVTMFRDAFQQSLPLGLMDVDHLAWQPTSVFLNGKYWGLMNLREKVDHGYFESNYGIEPQDVDIIEGNTTAEAGQIDGWTQYQEGLEALDPVDPATFRFIEEHIDVQQFINWMVVEAYSANIDWPNNIKAWRNRATNGKFRWMLWDMDLGWGASPARADWDHPTLQFMVDSTINTWFTHNIRLHMAVPEFRSRFIATMATSLATVYDPTRVDGMIDRFKTAIEAEMPYHKARWGGTMDQWQREVQRLRDFSVKRNEFMKNHIGATYGLSPINVSTAVDPPGWGEIEFNGTATASISGGTFFSGLPFTAKARPTPGYDFAGWTVSSTELSINAVASTGDEWKYFDGGALPRPAWKEVNFNDATWKTGPSQLGYGDGDERTVVGQGPVPGKRTITTYFRRNFTLADTAGISPLNGSVLFDDGVVVYLNGTEVFRNNMPAGEITDATLAASTIADENAFRLFSVPAKLLRLGQNTIAAEIHQASASSSDISFDLRANLQLTRQLSNATFSNPLLTGNSTGDIQLKATFRTADKIDGLVLNEVSAGGYGSPDGQTDWIELYNDSPSRVILDGLFISDDPANRCKFRIPGQSSLTVEPGGYRLLWADNKTLLGPDHLPFKLSRSGESIMVSQIIGKDTVVLASLMFSEQPEGFTLARIPGVIGPFMLTSIATPGSANRLPEAVQGLVINEFGAAFTGVKDEKSEAEDWIELYNASNAPVSLNGLFITDSLANPTKFSLFSRSAPVVIAPGGYQVLWADNDPEQGPTHLGFKLSADGEDIGIFQLIGNDTIKVTATTFGEQLNGFSSARIPDRSGPMVFTSTPTPGATNVQPPKVTGLVINEFSAAGSAAADEYGDQDDWIELFNGSGSPINLNGLFMTDSLGYKTKFSLFNDSVPAILQPGTHKVLWADNEPEEGPDHLGFKLSAGGEEIAIFQFVGSDTALVTSTTFGPQWNGYATARIPDATGKFAFTATPTPGKQNRQPSQVTGLVINEFSASGSAAADEAGDQDDWIELFNATQDSIDLSVLFITDSIGTKLRHSLLKENKRWMLAPGGYQVLWADNEPEEGRAHLPFKLSASGEWIGLHQFAGTDTLEVAVVGYDKTMPFFSNARIPNGTGELVYTIDVTPGSANQLPGPISGLVINEISAAGSTGTDEAGDHDDFIELYNGGTEPINLNGLVISDDPANPLKSGLRNTSSVKLLQPGAYHVIWLDEEKEEGPDHVSFKLSSDGEPVTIRQFTPTGLMPVASIGFGVQLPGFSLSRIPDATGEFVQTFSATPGQKNMEVKPVNGLVINELSPVESAFTDAFGEKDDWVELFNSGTEPVNLSGLFLSDKAGQPVRHLLNRDYKDWPLNPGEYALLWTDGQPEQGYDHLPMKLSAAGETITLAQVTRGDTLILDHYAYPIHPEGQSLARLPDGNGKFTYTATPSPGAKNSGDGKILDFFPNPVDDELKVLVRSGNTRMEVIDRLGKTWVDRFFSEPTYRTMDLSGLSSGIYFIRITGLQGTQTSRLAVIR